MCNARRVVVLTRRQTIRALGEEERTGCLNLRLFYKTEGSEGNVSICSL